MLTPCMTVDYTGAALAARDSSIVAARSSCSLAATAADQSPTGNYYASYSNGTSPAQVASLAHLVTRLVTIPCTVRAVLEHTSARACGGCNAFVVARP